MSFNSLLIHDITVSNPVVSGSDRYGNTTYGATTVVERMRVQPAVGEAGVAQEVLIDRDSRITRFKIFALPTTVVTGLSTLTWEGRTLRVDGEPLPFYGRSSLHHYEFTAEEVLG